MKKRSLLTTALLAAAILPALAQNADTAQVLVHYKFTHLRDTTDRAHPYAENMVLFVGKTASAYRSYDKQMQDALFKKEMQEKLAASPDGHVSINHKSTASGTEYYQYPHQRKLFQKEPLFINSYLMTDPLPAIDWKISGDTAIFGGLHCQKATAHFRGRDYTAWFSADLPLHVGPWKLNGLPGVIMEAYDTRKEVEFKFDGIEKAVFTPSAAEKTAGPSMGAPGRMTFTIGMEDDGDPNIIQPPAKAIKTTEKEFEHLKDAMRKDPDAFAESIMAAQNANLPPGGPRPDHIKIRIGPQPVINNPIELPEKK